jgi:hypothetical protein
MNLPTYEQRKEIEVAYNCNTVGDRKYSHLSLHEMQLLYAVFIAGMSFERA